MLLACPIISWCHAVEQSRRVGKERKREERETQKEREQTELAAITKCRCHASTSPGGFSGRFHIRLQTEATQTFECKEMEGV